MHCRNNKQTDKIVTVVNCNLLLEVVDLQRRLLAIENLNNYPTYLQGRPTSTFPKLKWTSENNTARKVNKTFNPFFIKQCSVVPSYKTATLFSILVAVSFYYTMCVSYDTILESKW